MTLVRAARAFAFGAPLAILAASFIGPPDPFSQLVNIGFGVLLFVPAAYVSVAQSGSTRTLIAFYGAILVATVVGSLAVNAVGGSAGLRIAVLVVAVAVGAMAAAQYG